jgi:hypothetical protein
VAATLVASGLSTATSAQASAPTVTRFPVGTTFSDSSSCGFTVIVTATGGDQTARLFSNGRQIIISAADTVLTLKGPTGRTYSVRANGPTFVSSSGTFYTFTGWTFIFGGLDGHGVLVGTGRSTIDLITNAVHMTGRFVDVCSYIAPLP